MAFQACFALKEQSIAFLRFLPSLYYCQKLSIPWNSIGTLRNLSTQYILNIHTDFLRSSQCHHYHSNHSKFENLENLKTEFEQVHHRAVQDTNALCRFSNRFYFLKLLAKITALLITIGFFNLAFYFLNPFPNSSAPGKIFLRFQSYQFFIINYLNLISVPFPILFRSRKWTLSKETNLSFDDVIGVSIIISFLLSRFYYTRIYHVQLYKVFQK